MVRRTSKRKFELRWEFLDARNMHYVNAIFTPYPRTEREIRLAQDLRAAMTAALWYG